MGERENFLNTFGKHLKAARVQKRLEGMRKNMDESVAPQTALGNIMKKLSDVQHMMQNEAENNGNDTTRRRNSIVSSEEMIIIDEIKSLLLSNIGKIFKSERERVHSRIWKAL